jgi:rubredoxin
MEPQAIAFTCPQCGHSFDKLAPEKSEGWPKTSAVRIQYETTCPACQHPKCETLVDYPYVKCHFCEQPVTLETARILVGTKFRDDDDSSYKYSLFSHKSCFNNLKKGKGLYEEYEQLKRKVYWNAALSTFWLIVFLCVFLPLAILALIFVRQLFNFMIDQDFKKLYSPDKPSILPIKLE